MSQTLVPRRPEVEILELTDEYIVFVLTKCDTSMANALRRVMIAEVPTMAIDKVEIMNNTTVLTDDFIAHRLGLVPLKSYFARFGDVESLPSTKDCGDLSDPERQSTALYVFNRDCGCLISCPRCTVNFDLNVDCEQDETLEVTTAELRSEQPKDCYVAVGRRRDEDETEFEPEAGGTEGHILLVKMRRGQKLKLRASAQMGIGKEHAKWQPCCTAMFAYEPEVELSARVYGGLSAQQRRDFVESCPKKLSRPFDPELRSYECVQTEEAAACMVCIDCLDHAKEYPGLAKVRDKPQHFRFTVETTGALRPEEIVERSIEVLIKKLDDIRANLDAVTDGAEV